MHERDEERRPESAAFGIERAARLRKVITRLARAMNESASSEDLTPTQASVLGAVAARGPLSASEVARIEGINPTMLSRVLGALEHRGMVLRSTDDSDQRRVVVEATSGGRAAGARIRERRAQVLVEVIDGLPPKVAAELAAALPALEVFAESLAAPPDPGSPA